jgi:hypothetical protein
MLEKLKTWTTTFKTSIDRHTLFWWILLWAQVAGLAVAYHTGILSTIWTEDVTKLTLVILGLHLLTTIKVGIDTANKNRTWVDPLWLGADQVFAIGILGTLCGFIILMHEAFIGGVPTTPAAIQKMLATMSSGMSTAFWVSACAIVSSMIQKVQVMNLEMATEKPSEKQ